MSKLLLTESGEPTVTVPSKIAITVTSGRGLRLTDINGSSVYAPTMYGVDLNYAVNKNQATTTSNAFQEYLNMPYTVTNNSASAIYELTTSFVWNYSSGSNDYRGRVVVNGGAFGQEFRMEPKDSGTDQRNWVTLTQPILGSELASLTGAIAFDFASSSGGNTARTHFCFLKLKRIA